MVKVEVTGVLLDKTNNTPILLLEDEEKRRLFIVVGLFEAQSILFALQNIKVERPLTHDLIKMLIEEFGGKPLRIEIVDIRDNIYFAQLIIQFNGRLKSISCRPSDGVAIALRCDIPVFVHKDIMNRCSVKKGSLSVSEGKGEERPIGIREVKEFKERLERLTPEEFWEKLRRE